jgi:hypothetical protein
MQNYCRGLIVLSFLLKSEIERKLEILDEEGLLQLLASNSLIFVVILFIVTFQLLFIFIHKIIASSEYQFFIVLVKIIIE